ncbi:MAG: helix-turn-helix domain-containing protein [Candidatus Thiodiazotropha sp.]
MSVTRRIHYIVYPGIEMLDLSGPAAVFSAANEISGRTLYEQRMISPRAGQIASHSGLMLTAQAIRGVRFRASDTVLVVGAYPASLQRALRDKAIRRALHRASQQVARFGSICTGAFLLARAGILHNRCATTHWAGIDALQRICPDTGIDSQALYVKDGPLWTSAGVASGIDMALAMLEEDHGAGLKARVAKQLVVYAHRPGYQSQFSELLTAQAKADDQFGRLVDWLNNRLDQFTQVSDMANFMAMSERSFHRKFTRTFAQTPAKFLEIMRLESARQLILSGLPANLVSTRVGFRSESAFRAAFKSQYGVTPGLYAQVHAL